MTTYVVNAKKVELYDDFDNDVLDTGLWSSFGSGVAVTDSELQLTTDLSPSSKGITSASTINLTGYGCSFELVQVPADLTSLQVYLQLAVDPTHNVQWALSQDVLYVNYNTGSGETTPTGGSFTFDPDAHKFLRIREDAGITYWESSSDGSDWTIRYQLSNPITVTGLTLKMSADTYETETTTATVAIDSVEVGTDAQISVTVD